MPSRERVALALGLVLTAVGFGGLGASFYVGPPSADQLKQISEKQTAIAREMKRPLDEDILAARVYLKPSLKDEDLSVYWGDDETCSRTKRELLVMNDSACGILDLARAKQEEYESAKKGDPVLAQLQTTVDFRRNVSMGGFIFGTNMIPAGLLVLGVFSSGTSRTPAKTS